MGIIVVTFVFCLVDTGINGLGYRSALLPSDEYPRPSRDGHYHLP